MKSEQVPELIQREYQTYVDHKIARPGNEAFDIEMATKRAMTRVALSTFSDEELQGFKDRVTTGGSFRHDAYEETYEGKVYWSEYVKTLSEAQLAQVIAYHALRPIRFHNDPREFVMVYNEEVGGFEVARLPKPETANI